MSEFPIITKLGGRDAVLALLLAKGRKRKAQNDKGPALSAAAMRMWRQRGQMPSDVITLLMEIADESGLAYSADDFTYPATTAAA